MRLKPARTLAVAAALAAVATIVVAPTPATAAGTAQSSAAGTAKAGTAKTGPATPTVWVNVKVSSRWPIGRAVSFVDHYTGSTLRFGRCHSQDQHSVQSCPNKPFAARRATKYPCRV